MNKFESLGDIEYDERLELLWSEYGFLGKPPKKDSALEKRLFEKCSKYATYMDGSVVCDSDGNVKIRSTSDFESKRRILHNEIAIMVSGRQRSGMNSKDAQNIANFAYEYVRGVRYDERNRYKK